MGFSINFHNRNLEKKKGYAQQKLLCLIENAANLLSEILQRKTKCNVRYRNNKKK